MSIPPPRGGRFISKHDDIVDTFMYGRIKTQRFQIETVVCAADLDHDAYKLPVSELINLWVTRYGNDWVDADLVEADPFYKHVHTRLRALGELEQHYLTDRNKYVCRRPE